MATIGIFGGLGPESTAAYYTIINREYYRRYRDYRYPEIVLLSVEFQKYIDVEYVAPEAVRESIVRLHRAGADFVVAACNSIHVVFDRICDDLPIPWVSIMDATAEQILGRGFRRVGLLGTIFTMGNGFYQRAFERFGLETIVPKPEAQRRVNRIIYEELVKAEIHSSSREYVLECMAELVEAGAEGVVLGCTELPFLIRQQDTDTPVFDTTAIHAAKALDLALADRA